MAEERNLGLQRAPETDGDTDATKAELQRRMEEARESITQTVTEIKETVVNQYQQVRESISDTLDWREQYRRHTLPFTIGAFGAGLVVGYGVMGALKGEGEEGDEVERGLYYDEEDATFDRIERGFGRASEPSRAYAPGASSGGAASYDVGPDTRPSYSSGYQTATAPLAATASAAGDWGGQEEEEEAPKGPSVFQRFKETKAYDKLQDELSTLGERAVEELSRTARSVVLPALLGKLKDMIGIDLSTQREGAQRSRHEQQTAQTAAAHAQADEGQQTSGQGASGGSASYAAGGGTTG